MNKTNIGHFHEIIDRSFLICNNIEDHLIDHPGMTFTMNEMLEDAISLISSVSNLASVEEEKFKKNSTLKFEENIDNLMVQMFSKDIENKP